MLSTCIDKKMLVYFEIESFGESDYIECASDDKDLLDLYAGSGVGVACDLTGSSNLPIAAKNDSSTYKEFRDEEDGSIINIFDDLLGKLEKEVSTCREAVIRAKEKALKQQSTVGKIVCPLCPCFSYSGDHRFVQLLAHIDHRHCKHPIKVTKGTIGARRWMGQGCFVASGFKQIKVIKCLYDNDTLNSPERSDDWNYLSRSASIIRESLSPAVPHALLVDRLLVLLLDKGGPRLVSRSNLVDMDYVRKSTRQIYITQEFANVTFDDGLLYNANMNKIRISAIRRAAEFDNELWHLLPTHTESSLAIREDIYFSPPVISLVANLLKTCYREEEFISVSVDATVKIAMGLIGQSSYRCSVEERNAAAIKDDEALRRVLTVRGRTSACLLIRLLKSEKGEEIAKAFLHAFTIQMRT